MSRIVALVEGRFGAAVGEHLRARASAEAMRLSAVVEALEQHLDGVGFVAVATWRLYDSECDAVDAACTRAGLPWSLCYLTGDLLSCGPLVVPSGGTCYRCFRRRLLTHHPAAEREIALNAAYAGKPDLGPKGFISPVVALAAHCLLDDARSAQESAGRLRRVNVCTGELVETRVLGVHGCDRCGSAPLTPGERFVRHLAPAVQEILR